MPTQWINAIVQLVRYLTGILFIISGLIKLNDPVGTQIKMEEYFTVFATDFHSFFLNFVPAALAIGILMCVLEVVLGVALLIQYRMRLTTLLLALLIGFFTFLTFYSAYFNKVTDCGCFGDAIKLTPWNSFTKDIVLSVMIGILYWRRRYLDPVLPERAGIVVVGISSLASCFLAYWAINHLPPIDFRKYKVGADIAARIHLPADEYEVMHKMKNLKTNTIEEVTTAQYMERWQDTTTWQYLEAGGSKLTKPGHPDRIADFKVYAAEQDMSDSVLHGNWLFVCITHAEKADKDAFPAIVALAKELEGKPVRLAILSADGYNAIEEFRHEVQLGLPVLTADEKVVKTIMRSVPGLWQMKDGKVVGKWHYNDLPTAATVLAL